MGRKVRRVALDFDWPMSKRWDGYVNPHWRECPEKCKGGYSVEYRALEPLLGRLCASQDPVVDKILAKLTSDRGSPFGYSTYDVASTILQLIGESTTCPTCRGSGIHPEAQAAHDAWTETDPPAGPGWQLWETTSEGSPISPVFGTPEALARWCADTRASWFGYSSLDYDNWLAFVQRSGG